MAVRVDLNISLDGVAMPGDPTAEHPRGEDWGRSLAEVRGAARVELHSLRDDPDGRGRWGDEPPFEVPVIDEDHTVTSEVAASGVVHVTFAR
ncbi:hypothetical protein [uncultured Microbacterium sp.]|uniref:hypothetical protein n=1 Tax=uncultured Microbacterium sp. TaxID=191216 RepID=UPI0025E81BAF|nr:hypothetical protein [uncultured Microbacterium sp.]